MLSNKLKNTREVTFSEAFKTKKGTVIYAKDSTHFIHKDVVANLKKKGSKFSAKEYEAQKKIEQAKKAAKK